MRNILLSALAAALLWAAPASATVTTIIAPPPGWQATHSYALKDRVTAGAGWNGSAYTSGSALCAFAVTVGGTSGSSASAFNTACASGTPAGIGGGLDGTIPAGWSGKTTVTDGGVTWVLLDKVDYVTVTGFNCDDAANWATGTGYLFISAVVNAGHCYVQRGSTSCTSAGSGPGPTSTVFNSAITDNDCSWYYDGEVTYTSTTHRLPHMVSILGSARFQMQYADNYVVYLMYGGAQRPSYVPGSNGELTPMQIHFHNDKISDADVRCLADSSLQSFDCLGTGDTYSVTYKCYPGDCWNENVAAGTDPLWYDVTKGVNIFNSATEGANSGAGDALNLGDGVVVLDGLQLVSVHNIGLSTTPATYNIGPTNTNVVWVKSSIIIGGDSGLTAFSCDIACNTSNSLIVSRSTVAQSSAVHYKYQGIFYNNTVVCASGVTNSTGISIFSEQATPASVPWKNNIFVGCTNPFAYGLSLPTGVDGADNATDVASAPTNTFTDLLFGTTYTAAALPGTTLSGITVANQFVNPILTAGADWRIKNTSADIYGAGAAFTFTPTDWFVWMGNSAASGLDIYQTTRPVSSRYDLGAAEFVAGAPAAVAGGRRLWH